MPPRPQWKGFLKLSLVSCPIALYPAISPAERISFRQVNKQTGHRLRQQLIDSVTGEVVAAEDKGRGYEVGQDQFLMVREDELAQAREEARARPFSAPPAAAARPTAPVPEPMPRSKPPKREELAEQEDETPIAPPNPPPRLENNRTIELDRFFPRAQLDPRYYHAPYYIAPRDLVGQEAFAVIRDAMEATGLVGMGRVILSNRERPILIEPMGRGLRGTTLHYAHEVRSETEYFADIPKLMLPSDMLEVAKHILNTKTAEFDPAYLEDRYRTAVAAMLRDKQAQLPKIATPSPTPTPENVINLMDVLKRSLAAEQPAGSIARRPPAASKLTRRKRSTARTRRSV
jgi:non-homologous end joining protein Ku